MKKNNIIIVIALVVILVVLTVHAQSSEDTQTNTATVSNEIMETSISDIVIVDISDMFDPEEPEISDVQSSDINKTDSTASVLNNIESDSGSDLSLETHISLIYDNAYSEKILKEGNELIAEIAVNNLVSTEKTLCCIIALYDNSLRMIDVCISSETVAANSQTALFTSIVIPVEMNVEYAKIMLWDGIDTMKPLTEPLIINIESEDYFGDSTSTAQPISEINRVDGQINTSEDTDVFRFVPQNDGLYYFEAFSEIDTNASIFDSGNLITPVASDDNSGVDDNFRLSATLTANKTYYLFVTGTTAGDYSFNYGYAVGNIFGTVSPVKYYDESVQFNKDIESTVTLKTLRTNEYVATMHLKDWSESNSTYATFSMTGIHAGEYLVEVKRPGYLTMYKKITLQDNVVDIGSIVLIPGDLDSNNIVDESDVIMLNEHIGAEYGDESYITAADLNGDKTINESDLSLLNDNMSKTSNDYNENVNVLSANVDVRDSTITVSGIGKAASEVKCCIYLDNYCLYEEVVTCTSDGTFALEFELNRNGAYTILVIADDNALTVEKSLDY